MVTLIMSKFSLVWAESKLVKLGKLLSEVGPMKGPRLDAARRASIKARSELADAFAANVRHIIKEIQASGVASMRGLGLLAVTVLPLPLARRAAATVCAAV
jgi:hypothetical protein